MPKYRTEMSIFRARAAELGVRPPAKNSAYEILTFLFDESPPVDEGPFCRGRAWATNRLRISRAWAEALGEKMTEGIMESAKKLSDHRASLIDRYREIVKQDEGLIASLKEIIRLKDSIIATQESYIKRLEMVLKL